MTTIIFSIILGFVLGALACYLIIDNHLRQKYDEQLKLMYKTYYNDTFKQITGRSWLDSDN